MCDQNIPHLDNLVCFTEKGLADGSGCVRTKDDYLCI